MSLCIYIEGERSERKFTKSLIWNYIISPVFNKKTFLIFYFWFVEGLDWKVPGIAMTGTGACVDPRLVSVCGWFFLNFIIGTCGFTTMVANDLEHLTVVSPDNMEADIVSNNVNSEIDYN